MFDTMGRIVYHKEPNDWNPSVVAPVPPGVYSLLVKTENGKYYRKMIVKK
jgi:hypothetical protein